MNSVRNGAKNTKNANGQENIRNAPLRLGNDLEVKLMSEPKRVRKIRVRKLNKVAKLQEQLWEAVHELSEDEWEYFLHGE